MLWCSPPGGAGPGGAYAGVSDGSGGLLILRYAAYQAYLPVVTRGD